MLENLQYIMSSGVLLIEAILYATLGLSFFALAIKLCGPKGFKIKALKYLTTAISVGFTSSFFTLLLHPTVFYSGINTIFILQSSFLFVVLWIALYELYQSFFQDSSESFLPSSSGINSSGINGHI